MPLRALSSLALVAVLTASGTSVRRDGHGKLDPALRALAHASGDFARVIVSTADGTGTDAIRAAGGHVLGYLPHSHDHVALIESRALDQLASRPDVLAISLDRPVRGAIGRTSTAIGARWVHEHLGVDGTGVGIATIDSGISPWHDDLPQGRVARFVDFVNHQPSPYDDYGHGTHVAGILAGSGKDSDGARRGIAPGAHLVVLKALDAAGGGYISNVMAAIDFAIANRAAFNIRVINLSVAAGVFDSYSRDPLALAARRAVNAGLVVVAAAGNLGRGLGGDPQYGAIAAPGNAPWVLTAGASSHMGTPERSDDVVAGFSSRGPTPVDRIPKPDLVAPGVGIESTTEPASALFAAYPASRVAGTAATIHEPYLALSGTSMAAPVVAATAALMLHVNPALTPNAVKAILQYTAEIRPEYDHLTQGAGFLNTRGAVHLARVFAGVEPEDRTQAARWGRQIFWGASRITAPRLPSAARAWDLGVDWGAATMPGGQPVAWTDECPSTADCARDIVVTPLCDGAACLEEPLAWVEGHAFDAGLGLVVAGHARCDSAPHLLWTPRGEPVCVEPVARRRR
ncbi:MAG TPA: S8 family serine peptidase [Vicinamibacterales bacterium]|nr:S8 family serine peptidase [Vicinamibacterales bacterium]